MSNSIELINRVEALEAELHKLKEELVREQDEPEIPDFPVFNANGEASWWSNNSLDVTNRWFTSGHVADYNYFHTEAYAQEFAKNCKIIAMMLHCKWYLDREYEPDWESDTDSEKFYVIFDNCDNKFQVRTRYAEEGVEVYFSTADAAQKCSDWLNKHWRDSE